jgi:hypothetical protein
MLKRNKSKNITFTNVTGASPEYAPKPAIHFIPNWYKEMEASFPKKRGPETLLTIKKCIPVLDAITAGYIIVSPCDIYVTFENEAPKYTPAPAHPNIIEFHPMKQGYKHPNANGFPFPKWVNPWGIKTPKGYSCLFIPPMHNENEHFEILEGIVDTDSYFATINFPFVLKNPKQEFLIPAGTPIAQVIPFKRDAWKSKFSENVGEPRRLARYVDTQFFDRYKRLFWNRKSYS